MDIETFKKVIKRYEPYHSSFIMRAEAGRRYYENRTDILFQQDKKDEEGNPMRNADNRIPRNFHGLIVNQKAAYAFTVPPVFDVGSTSNNKRITECLGDEYGKNCMELCINASNTSIGWVHYWESDAGFEWAVVDSDQIIPIWDRSLKKKLIGVLRVYEELDDETGDNYIIYEYWTDTMCQAFRRKAADEIEIGLHYYDMFYSNTDGEMTSQYAHSFGEVPFIPFHNNNINTSDLDNIKSLIDVYDKVYSGFVNDLEDVQELIFVIQNYGGTDLNGFLQDLKKYKVIKTDDDGSADTLSIEIPVEARKTLLDITRKAIFEQGQGFDPQPESFGNQSGEALKFMYSLLEMKTGFMEIQFRIGFATLIRAICRYLNIPCETIIQTWTRNRIKNDTEQADICQKSVGIVSKKTILKNHPLVENADAELKQLEIEEKQAQEKAEAYQSGAFFDASKDQEDDTDKEDKEDSSKKET